MSSPTASAAGLLCPLVLNELMNHVADDVPTATQQNGSAANPQHRDNNRRHMSLLVATIRQIQRRE